MTAKRGPAKARAAKKSVAKLLYPKRPIEESIKLIQAIKEKNAGNPMEPDLLAQALGYKSRQSDIFYYLAASSRDFGLTSGSRDSDKISLTDLGKKIVYASSPEEEIDGKIEAFLSNELFKKVLEYYKGSSLPEMKYLGNTLEKEFGLIPEYHEEFSQLFKDNCAYLKIKEGVNGDSALSKGEAAEAVPARPATIIVGEPQKKSSLVAFVILPFNEKQKEHPDGFFQEVLSNLIVPAAREAGFTVKTANRQGSDIIQSTIINDLIEADLVIADLTEHNPNVLFELGIRLAIEKPVAIIKATGTGKIFDVDNMIRVYEYNSNLWASTVVKDLPSIKEHIAASWETKDKSKSYFKVLSGK